MLVQAGLYLTNIYIYIYIYIERERERERERELNALDPLNPELNSLNPD